MTAENGDGRSRNIEVSGEQGDQDLIRLAAFRRRGDFHLKSAVGKLACDFTDGAARRDFYPKSGGPSGVIGRAGFIGSHVLF